ncbi:MAG: phosphate ABC transporter substrate-binding protein [Nitrospiraceae bacterium]|nr:MAG: phosphate ABC transporter substrate-binding protein [Nitrospiraceae bacterium]
MKKVTEILGLLFLVTVCLAYAFPAYSDDHLTASGCSVSYVGYLKDLAQEYERRTGIKIHVRGGGTVGGLENLKEGKVDFAATCRNRIEGDPEDVKFIQTAWDALVFIVHKSNTVKNISTNDVKGIYAGRISNWKQLGGKNEPIKVFIARTTKSLSGIESSLRDMVLGGKPPVEGPNVKLVPTGGMVEQTVEKTPDGFAASGFTSARKRNLKILKVDGISPTKENIIKNRYKLKRPLFLVVPKNPEAKVKKFLDFALSEEGQRFIGSLGVVSLYEVKPVKKGGAL